MKVNIVLSTYNGEKFLSEQIESIQAQTFTDWQLLIRDDGSTDKTLDIITAYTLKDERIHWIDEDERKNLGVINSFYKLIKHDVADYYFFCDQDDVWLPEKMTIMLAEATKYDADKALMVYMDLSVVDKNLKVINPSMINSQSHHANTSLLAELTENTVTGGVAMVNHALVKRWSSSDNMIMHDWYLALLATATGKLVYIDKPGELYRQHDHNVLGARTLAKRFKKWLNPLQAIQKYWELIITSQKQAAAVLNQPDLSDENRELIEKYVALLNQTVMNRIKYLKEYNFKKNKLFHTIVFRTLVVTKLGYVKK
ncbi:glycosyltransferase family 2 protein [Lactococcus piscium]|uniref:Alpha-L-Rha alpha-1,3-L-rhamnosyltransferase n=1 Tax=Pseudolactococcus paracarnosus TaxID=2749962 RepID=A0A7L4WEZ1_9LACT|nr:glycosyltransferase family 2 protein [Lactococcus paracarnosus]MBR3055021.1 glycosyltransferase family 2 protein [Streptococcus sp.]SPC36895.1 Alpha-L-Rha alpha-1,3-L-rhamnosyltransferase [Lactococcus piscium]MCJ1976869.1 glycosyltransferase family 2 protein [Lactococcus paracarnosus]MCJ1982745.1 glycosyltransferase family 2 protein [Lactococcus paracarnosus]MCJ1994868.1 glycosyltransferase family 2 protein [Lactococcus paracarnosus]